MAALDSKPKAAPPSTRIIANRFEQNGNRNKLSKPNWKIPDGPGSPYDKQQFLAGPWDNKDDLQRRIIIEEYKGWNRG